MPPTTYHLRNESGIEVFTGSIFPAPGGGSQPLKRVAVTRDFSDFDESGLSTVVYSLQPGEQLMAVALYPTVAFDDTAAPNFGLTDAATQSVPLSASVDATTTPAANAVAGLVGIIAPSTGPGGTNWGDVKGIVQPDTIAVDLAVQMTSWNADGTAGTAQVYLWVWAE